MRFPSWVPPAITSEVSRWLEVYAQDYRDHPGDLEVLHRLVTARRMRRIWVELERHRATPPDLKRFLFTAYDAACHKRPVASGPQLDEVVAKLRSDAESRRNAGDVETAEMLDAAAQTALSQRSSYGADPAVMFKPSGWRPPRWVMVRRSAGEKNDAARAYVLELANLTHELFGTVLMRTVATTASVALKRAIDWNQVRHWIAPLSIIAN